jgi:hypothetical protein
MDGFDMLSMGLGMLDPDNVLTGLNNKLHSSVLYEGFQLTVNAVAIFTGVASTKIMCFVAGTMVLVAGGVAAGGLIAIETIKAGDMVIATNAETGVVEEKKVFETYAPKTSELVKVTIGEEEIHTTPGHPFYVKDRGFVKAGKLQVGDQLIPKQE